MRNKLKKWIQNIFGITQLIAENKRSNDLLEKILNDVKRNSDLAEAYNKAYHIN